MSKFFFCLKAIPLVSTLGLLLFTGVQAAETLVHTQAEYREAVAQAQPGDEIILANGVWRDFEVLFSGNGEPESPITLKAETKGQVFLSGQSNLRLSGTHLVVSGLVFKDGYSPTQAVISFRRTKGEYAYYSRVTETVIDRFNNPERHETDFWVLMFGQHNRFDHNHLEGKGNAGVTMAVRLDDEENQQNHHRIDHNYFGPRPTLGSNGGETLRIGTSHYSLTDSNTVVENNVFDRCNGEVEIISSKSGGNIFRGNLFLESRGTLTLRHGNNTLIENNVFLGNGVLNTGGIRVINKGHVVRNNYLHGLTGYRFGGGFVIMNGVPNSPINRYHQVEDVLIENNTLIDVAHVEFAAGSDEERSAPPIRTTFRSNLIFARNLKNSVRVHDDISGISFSNNASNVEDGLAIELEYIDAEIGISKAENGLFYPTGSDPADLADIGIRGDLKVLRKDETGVSWYPKPPADAHGNRASKRTDAISVSPGADALIDAVNRALPNSTIVLGQGEYRARKLIVVDKPLTIENTQEIGSVRLEFERSAMFELGPGGSLTLRGLEISGASAPDVAGNSLIRTSRYSMVSNYSLQVEDCVIQDLDTNHSFNFFSVSKNTFADKLSIARTKFANITGNVIALNKEGDDLGRYNGEFISVQESEFRNIGGAVLDIYRGGTDESTFGPRLVIETSVFESVGHSSRNKTNASIRLLGVQRTDIQNNQFTDSEPIRVIHTVGDPITTIVGNSFAGTAGPQIEDSGTP